MRSTLRSLALAAGLAVLASFPIHAGTVSLTWDPVTLNGDGSTCTDLAGYRVYWGSAPGSYTSSRDVGNVTETVIDGVTDCTAWYLAVKAYDTAGNLSEAYSNEVSGWARPVVISASPAAAEQGRRLDLVVGGTNFMPGATVQLGAAGITVNSVTVNSCMQVTANVTVGGSAAVGATNVDVTNPDTVYGSGAALFTVQAAVAPTVSSTSPANGATGIGVSVHPTVTFSEAMLASSVTASTVRLLDDAGSPVAQAAGSPALSADGITATITPAASLAMGETYRIQVVGGASGVFDLANHPMASTFTQSTGFSTTPDSTAPVISSVDEASVGSSTARITWSTDESADSQVFYRKAGQTAYQQTAVDATMVTGHAIDLVGLEPSTTYQYHVRSADAGGNASTSSPDQTFTTTASTYSYMDFEAEAGALTSPVRTSTGAGSFGGSWIDTPTGTSTGSPTSPSGTAVFGINVPAAGTWRVWVRVYGANASSDAWFESMDGGARQALTASPRGAWTWVAARSYSLTAGLHSFELGGYEAQARADRVLVTDDPAFTPSEQPVDDQTAPGAPAAFGAAPSDRQNTLSWTNPADSDYRTTSVRYRTDGRFPTSPFDGYAVADKSSSPGAGDSAVHNGLTNGVTYSYSAFAIDASGNVSAASHAQGTPADLVPPSQVKNARRKDKRP